MQETIEEIDVVALKEPVGHWPAGAQGTVMLDFGNDKLLEMSGDRDDPLDLPVVPAEKLELVVKYHD
jgi:hypothetical protein